MNAEEREQAGGLRVLAGEELELVAEDLLGSVAAADDHFLWKMAGHRSHEPTLQWTPTAPGTYLIELESKGWSARRLKIVAGLRPQDLIDRRRHLRFLFCLVARRAGFVDFLPYISAGPGKEDGSLQAGDLKDIQRADTSAIGLAKWIDVHTRIYQRHVLHPRPFLNIGLIPEGLYAIFPEATVYLGNSPAIQLLIAEVRNIMAVIRDNRSGSERALRQLQDVSLRFTPFAYRYSDQPQWPTLGAHSSSTHFMTNAIGRFLQASAQQAGRLGLPLERGGPVAVVTYNGVHSMVASRLIDTRSGVSQHVVSGFDVLLTPRRKESLRDILGPALASRFSGLSQDAPSIPGRDGSSYTPLGLSPIGQRNSQLAMAKDGGNGRPVSDVKDVGVKDNRGDWHVTTEDGSDVRFDRDSNGDPQVIVLDEDGEGGFVVTGAETSVVFGPVDVEGDDDAGTDTGDDAGTDTGDDAGTDTGDDAGDGSEPPSGADPDAVMPNPDDADGETTLGPIGTITLGGGYSDPPHDGEDKGPAGGIIVAPGGGNVDPPQEDTGIQGHGVGVIPGGGYTDPTKPWELTRSEYWANYSPPSAGQFDRILNGGVGSYTLAPVTRTDHDYGGIRIYSWSGTAALSGVRADGLIGGALGEPGRR